MVIKWLAKRIAKHLPDELHGDPGMPGMQGEKGEPGPIGPAGWPEPNGTPALACIPMIMHDGKLHWVQLAHAYINGGTILAVWDGRMFYHLNGQPLGVDGGPLAKQGEATSHRPIHGADLR